MVQRPPVTSKHNQVVILQYRLLHLMTIFKEKQGIAQHCPLTMNGH